MRLGWPPFCCIVAYKGQEEKRNTEAMRRLTTQRLAQRGRPAVPDHWTGRPGGSGAQPPLHLIYMVKVGQSKLLTVSMCVRFAPLRAAIVHIVRRRDRERTQISSFLSSARKKKFGRHSPRSGIGSEADAPRILV